MNHSEEVHAEYASLISSLILCNHFNPEDDKALRKSLKFIRRRLKTSEIRHMCQVVIRAKGITPTEWLSQKIEEMQEVMPVLDFLAIARSRVDS